MALHDLLNFVGVQRFVLNQRLGQKLQFFGIRLEDDPGTLIGFLRKRNVDFLLQIRPLQDGQWPTISRTHLQKSFDLGVYVIRCIR